MVKANSVQRRMNKYFLDRILNQDKKLYCIEDYIKFIRIKVYDLLYKFYFKDIIEMMDEDD